MTLRFTLFAAISVLVHAGVLLWSQDIDPQLRLGGEAQALRVSIATAEPAAVHEPKLPTEQLAIPERTTERKPTKAVSSPAVHHLAQVDTDAARTTRPTNTPGHKPAQTGRPTQQEKRVSANTPSPAKQSAPDISRRISVALKNRLSRYFEYPWLARQRGWEGRVLLSLTVMGNGDLGDWKIARTSGYRTLDQSALKAARRIERLPQAATWLNGESLEVQVPVQYQLLDS